MATRSRRLLALAAAAALAAGVVSCNKSPASPSPAAEAGQFVSLRLLGASRDRPRRSRSINRECSQVGTAP